MIVNLNTPDALEQIAQALRTVGFAVVPDFLPAEWLAQLPERLYAVQENIVAEVGMDRLKRAGEYGVLRLMMRFDPLFADLLVLPGMTALVDRLLGNTAILHTQNGFILPPETQAPDEVFQYSFHMDFPRHLQGYLASINVFLAIDTFHRDNGATLVVPGSQQQAQRPLETYMRQQAIAVECPAGSAIVFDSTLWHAAGRNRTARDRLAINHQFTRSWIKQQIDYCRAVPAESFSQFPERAQQMLGGYTRVVTSLDEYYQPEERRLYRRGQG